MLCQFQVYSKVSQLYVYIYPLFLKLFPIQALETIEQHSSCYIVGPCCSSVAQSFVTLCDPMDCSTARLSCPSPTPRTCSNSCPSSQSCHPTISSSVVPFSYCLQSFPASGSFLTSWLFASGGPGIGDSALASVLISYLFYIQQCIYVSLNGIILN